MGKRLQRQSGLHPSLRPAPASLSSGLRPDGGHGRFFLEDAPDVRARLERAGWQPTRAWDFDLYWRRQVPSLPFFEQLPAGARVNHIPGIAALVSPERRATPRAQGQSAGVAIERLVLLASVDPLRLFVHDAEGAALAAPLRDALDALVVDAVAAAYDTLVRRSRDHLVDRGAVFELLRLHARGADDGTLVLTGWTLSPAIDDAVAATVLALIGLVPSDVPALFRCVVPGTASRAFLDACPWPRWSDLVANAATDEDDVFTHAATSRIVGGAVVLFHTATARFHVLNDTAGYVWERTREGLAPREVADAIARQFGLDPERARDDVWDALARWANEGWIARGRPAEGGARERDVPGRCSLAAGGAIVAPSRGDAIALVGREPSGVGAVAALLSLRGGARVVSDAPWVDEASGRAVPSAARLAIHETDAAEVARASAAFQLRSGPLHVAANEVVFRIFEPEPWRGEAPVVGPIVVVRRAPRGAPTSLRRLPVRDLLLELVALGMRADPPWSPRRADELLAWLEETPGYVLEARDAASGADALGAMVPRDP